MTVIAIEGRAGSGAVDVGRAVAREMGLDFVDRLLLAEIARRVGATVEAVHDSTLRTPGRGERFVNLVQRMLERSSVAGAGGDPYFGPGVDTLIARPYAEMSVSPATSAQEVDEQHFISTTAEVIRDVAEAGNAVIVSRGCAAILRDKPDVLRVGLVAQRSDRARRVLSQFQLDDMEAAEQYVDRSDTAQARYFERAFGTSPLDPFLYHVMWNLSQVSDEWAAARIMDASRALSERTLR
ncbi:MAG: cytidylate kinase-like family protein [Chloroflexi bacterium]|nr:cytidylate kinase-like family protein [Chloroflexota bacterium]